MKKCKTCGGTDIMKVEPLDRYDPSYTISYYCGTCKEYKVPTGLEEV